MSRRSALRRGEVWMQVKDRSELRRAREFERYTQRDLAALCRCSQTTIYLLEKGEMRTLSDRLALSIAGRLRRPVESLFVPKVTTDSLVTERRSA